MHAMPSTCPSNNAQRLTLSCSLVVAQVGIVQVSNEHRLALGSGVFWSIAALLLVFTVDFDKGSRAVGKGEAMQSVDTMQELQSAASP